MGHRRQEWGGDLIKWSKNSPCEMEQRKELLAREVERAVQLREFALVFHMGDRATCMSIETTQRIEKLEMQRRKGRHCRSVRALRREGSRTQRKRGGIGLSNSICKLQKTELDLVTPFSPKMKLVKFLCIWGFLFVESVELIYYRCSSSLFHILVLNW